MRDETWKRVQRDVAKYLGGRRGGCTGEASPDVVDIPGLAVEVKHRRSLPGWLLDALAQAEDHAGDGETAVAVLHQHRQRIADSLVVLRLEDFVTVWQCEERST